MDLVTIVSELGFPIVIALYLMIRIETAVKDLITAVSSLEQRLAPKG